MLLLSLLCGAFAVGAFANDRVMSADARWKTIKTEHYLIHYPANPKGEFESFAREIASKIEGIHAKVAEWVGYEEKCPLNVVLSDPILEANGMVAPLPKKPRVIFYKTSPEPDSEIGHFDNWVEDLVTHELTHVHHLLRPKNGKTIRRGLPGILLADARALPILLDAPRVIEEGYATLIEGRITGSGRPHSAYRAAVIRQWALQGMLPDYDAVSGSNAFKAKRGICAETTLIWTHSGSAE